MQQIFSLRDLCQVHMAEGILQLAAQSNPMCMQHGLPPLNLLYHQANRGLSNVLKVSLHFNHALYYSAFVTLCVSYNILYILPYCKVPLLVAWVVIRW